jgi:cytochrome b6-f complex iron-sulfur subunit
MSSEALNPELNPPHSSRRDSLIKIGTGLVAACYAGAAGYPVYRYLSTPVTRANEQGQVSTVSIPLKDLPGAGSATMFLFGSRPALLIHHADGRYVSFDAVCTHLGCTVKFEPRNSRIFCACHGGTYDMNTGAVIAGPPPRGLTNFKVEVADGHVTVSRA